MSKSKPSRKARIEATPRCRQAEVLELLHQDKSRIRHMLQQPRLDMDGLFHARRGNRLVGAAWGQVLPGNTAFCWSACLVPNEPENTAVALQRAVDQYLDASNVTVTQAILPRPNAPEARRLYNSGYRHLADLAYMVCRPARYPADNPASALTFRRANSNDNTAFGELVQRTYIDTLDCPALDAARTIDDIMAGYRATGQLRLEWWLFVQHHSQDVGCLIMADHPSDSQCELVYQGLVPEVRGRRWGLAITRYAQWLAFQAGRNQLVLAVDVENRPAKEAYVAAGFEIWDLRSVLVRTRG